MAAQWNVEGALDEVVSAVQDGALVLKLDELTKEMIKKIYRPGFEARTEEEWLANRPTLLALARKAGRGAELGSILLWVHEIALESEYLDRETVCLICVAVSRMDCTIGLANRGEDPALKGIFCPKVSCPGAAGERLDAILKKLGA